MPEKDLKIGRELTLYYYRLICPHCKASEDSDLGEYDRFDMICLEDVHGWKREYKCLKCNKHFWTVVG